MGRSHVVDFTGQVDKGGGSNMLSKSGFRGIISVVSNKLI